MKIREVVRAFVDAHVQAGLQVNQAQLNKVKSPDFHFQEQFGRTPFEFSRRDAYETWVASPVFETEVISPKLIL